MGVPQGSILSPAVFNIKTKTNIKTESSNVGKAVFTETAPGLLRVLPFVHTGQFMQRAMQLVCVNNARNWVLENRFKYFTSKTVCIHFQQQCIDFPRPDIIWERSRPY